MFIISAALATAACKQNDKRGPDFFPALSFIQSQVKNVDTSVYPLLKIVTVGSQKDTVYLRREDFRKEAHDFLSLPDITARKWRKIYTETKMYDEDLNRVVLTYTRIDEEAEIRRQEVTIEPSTQNGDRVKSIYIDEWLNEGDSTVQKRMTWKVDRGFQVVYITQKKGQPEKTETKEVTWNAFSSQ